MASQVKRVLILICSILLMVLASCGPDGEDYRKKEDHPEAEVTEHRLELVSSVWGFGTTNNVVMSADTGFFCISREGMEIYPTFYDPYTNQKKSLNTESLLPYFEGYQVFTAGDRLIACTEDNSVINVILPPYEEVSGSYALKDKGGKIWRIYCQSAIVYDREHDTVYCSLTDGESNIEDPSLLACVELNTGLVMPLLYSEQEECLTLFACNSENMLVLMKGRSSARKQSGEAETILFDLNKADRELDYSGKELEIADKDEYCGYAFGEDGIYYISQCAIKKYDFADGTVSELYRLSTNRTVPSQVLTDERIRFTVNSSDSSDTPNWYDTVSGELLAFSFLGTDGIKYSVSSNTGLYGECGEWYCLVKYGPSSSISDNEYVLVNKQEYWTGTAEVTKFTD